MLDGVYLPLTINKDLTEAQAYAYRERFNSLTSIVAAVAIAVARALLWKFLAVSVGAEFGISAWAIGAAIGGGAAMFGASRRTDGVFCAVLLVLAIAGGKYVVRRNVGPLRPVLLVVWRW